MIKRFQHRILSIITLLSLLLLSSYVQAQDDLIKPFPLGNYDQQISHWIKPETPDYDKPLLSAELQQQRFKIFLDHYFGSHSPWNAQYISKILQLPSPDDLKTLEKSVIDYANNRNKPEKELMYGVNYRVYDERWIERIEQNINLSQFDRLTYDPDHRAIAIQNLYARVLPTDDPGFYNHRLAGEGYPFDNLQMSSVWAGTPLYVFAETADHVWSLVLTPDYIAWVKSNGIARAADAFINQWQHVANSSLLALIRETSIREGEQFLFTAYVGSVFPAEKKSNGFKILIPTADANHHARIAYTNVEDSQAVLMPFTATPHHFAQIMQGLINRPYGWGGLYFYNDCSAELKSLFTPFGIWLPRHSAEQVSAGKVVDMSSAPTEERIQYLIKNGNPFLTLVYIDGHIFQYLGNFPNPNSNDHELMAMTYQNIWGLKPTPPTRRAVIGQAVLFPLLLQYPEDPTLSSLAARKYFRAIYLNRALETNELGSQTINLQVLLGAPTGK